MSAWFGYIVLVVPVDKMSSITVIFICLCYYVLEIIYYVMEIQVWHSVFVKNKQYREKIEAWFWNVPSEPYCTYCGPFLPDTAVSKPRHQQLFRSLNQIYPLFSSRCHSRISSALRTITDLCSQQVAECSVVFSQAPVKGPPSWQGIKK